MENKIQKNSCVNILTKMIKKELKVNVLTRKKGQMTLFMILGLIILFAFGFLYFGMSSTKESRIRSEVVSQVEDVLNQQAVDYATWACLLERLEDGLVLIGNQGGYIDFPPGVTANFDNIAYLIAPSPYIPPQYPCFSSANAPAYCGFINNVSIYPQDKLFAVNFGKIGLLPFLEGNVPTSIKTQLENYVSSRLPECLTDLSQSDAIPYDFSPGEIKSEIEFTASEVIVKTKIPLQMTVPGVAEPIVVQWFKEATAEVRFKLIYDILREIIQYDNTYLDFDILGDTNRKSFQVPGEAQPRQLRLRTVDNISLSVQFGEPDDVFTIKDESSKARLKDYEFKFARKNRYPVLDYIPAINPPRNPFDFVFFENDTIKIKPKGTDPDEDFVTYSYEGWKADYDSIWDPVNRRQNTAAIPSNKWEDSIPFKTTNKDAELTVTNLDVGIHNFTVRVNDSYFSDYQTIRVMVERVLQAKVLGDNLYSDVDNIHASIEDPYLLNSTSETILVDPNMKYNFEWIDTASGVIHKGDISCLLLPITHQKCFATSPTIDNMGGFFNFLSAPGGPSPKVILKINATGLTNQTAETKFNLSVHECLPHRNPNSPPYPFQTIDDPSNPLIQFQGDHTCCLDNFDLATSSTQCFKFQEYTCWSKPKQETGIAKKAVRENPSNEYLLEDATVVTTPSGAPGATNDIFQRTFIQYCSGNRGNVCSGEIEDTIIKYIDCDDIDKAAGEDENCKGPSRYPSCEIEFFLGEPKCHEYEPGESFEKNFAITDKPPKERNGICNENWKRSALGSPRGAYGVPTGPYDCQAACGDGECNTAYNCLCNAAYSDTVDPRCDGREPGYAFNEFWDWGDNLELGCQIDCTVIDCEPWTFDPNRKVCRDYARDENDCDEDGTFNPATHKCE